MLKEKILSSSTSPMEVPTDVKSVEVQKGGLALSSFQC